MNLIASLSLIYGQGDDVAEVNIIPTLPHLTYKRNGSDVQVIESSDIISPKVLSIIH